MRPSCLPTRGMGGRPGQPAVVGELLAGIVLGPAAARKGYDLLVIGKEPATTPEGDLAPKTLTAPPIPL
jgi:hypothetical protein